MNMHMFAGKMERELFNYMKFDGGTMPFNEDTEFEASRSTSERVRSKIFPENE